MSRYRLQINLDDSEELETFSKAELRSSLVFDLKHNFWREWKHANLTDEQYEMKEEVLKKLYALIDSYEDD